MRDAMFSKPDAKKEAVSIVKKDQPKNEEMLVQIDVLAVPVRWACVCVCVCVRVFACECVCV